MPTLITASQAKQYIPGYDSADDAFLDDLIARAESAIDVFLHRTLCEATYDDRYDGSRFGVLHTREFPLTLLSRAAIARSRALQVRNTDTTTNQRARVTTTSVGMTLIRVASGVENTDTITWATDVTVTAVETAINALSGGWEATAVSEFGLWASTELYGDQGPKDAMNQFVDILVWDEELNDVEVTHAGSGQIRGAWPRGFQNVRLQYTAGYTSSTLPADITQAIGIAVSAWYLDSKTDTTMKREKLGDYEYEIGGVGSSASSASTSHTGLSLPSQSQALLAPYKDRACVS